MFSLRKKWVFSWLLACLVAVTYFLLKPHQAIVFLKDSKLMSRPFPDGCISGCQATSVLAEIHAGDTALIVEDFDTKNFHVRKIRVKDGKEGYVFDDREFKSLDPQADESVPNQPVIFQMNRAPDLAINIKRTKTATVADPLDPFSVTQLVEKSVVNEQTYLTTTDTINRVIRWVFGQVVC